MDTESISKVFKERARLRIAPIARKLFTDFNIQNFYLAGGGLLKNFNDLDLYPTELSAEMFSKQQPKGFPAYSLNINGTKVQLCNFNKNSLKELVDSFDFSHCQVGAEIYLFETDRYPNEEGSGDESESCNKKLIHVQVDKVYFSDQFVNDMVNQTTSYTGSEYPLSSLCRIRKVANKLDLPRGKTDQLVVQVLADILERGFKNYGDFLSQLQSVDVSLAQDSEGNYFDTKTVGNLKVIYEKLTKDAKSTWHDIKE